MAATLLKKFTRNHNFIVMKCLKSTLTILFLVLTTTMALVAQPPLSIQGIKESGESINMNEVFLLNDFCTFFIQDHQGNKLDLASGKWQLVCKGEDDNFIEREVNNQAEFAFLLDDLRVSTETLQRKDSDTDHSVYFEAYISCIGSLMTGQNFNLSFPIYLNLLPPMPTHEIIGYENTGAYYTYIDVFCDYDYTRSDELRFIQYEFEEPNRQFTTSFEVKEPFFQFRIDLDMITEFRFSSRNKFGWVSTGRIKVPEYIYTSINNPESNNSISLFPNPFQNKINISGDINLVKSLSIYSIKGELVKAINRLESSQINLKELIPGMYLMHIEFNDNSKPITCKLIKNLWQCENQFIY